MQIQFLSRVLLVTAVIFFYIALSFLFLGMNLIVYHVKIMKLYTG